MFLAVFLYKNDNVYAQTDSLKVDYRQESIDSSDYSLKRNYKYLNISLKEEKNLLKFGFKPFTLLAREDFQFATSIVFEKKIYPEWSVLFELENSFGIYESVFHHSKIISMTNTLNVGARYYYGMNRKIKQGKTANNFNGNFLELSINSIPPLNHSKGKLDPEGDNYYNQSKLQGTAIQLSWGIQRRLNNFLFFDAKVFADCLVNPFPGTGEKPVWHIGFDCTIGFGHNIKRK